MIQGFVFQAQEPDVGIVQLMLQVIVLFRLDQPPLLAQFLSKEPLLEKPNATSNAIIKGVDLNGQQLLGFEPDSWTGDWKTILKLETVFYAPWNIIGFRFAPVFQIGVGTLGYEQEPLFTRPIQPALGLGIMIRNENLIFNTFQLSLGFYPQVVPGAPSLFRWNALEQFQLRNPDLASTRPDVLHIP